MPTRHICAKAYGAEECEVCVIVGKKGWPSRPKFCRMGLVWDYSQLTRTFTPKSGANAGKEMALDPYGVMTIEAGENKANWLTLETAYTQGIGWPNVRGADQIWEATQVSNAGLRIGTKPIYVLGEAISPMIDPTILAIVDKLTAARNKVGATTEEIYGPVWAQCLATCHGVNWKQWGLTEPERPRIEKNETRQAQQQVQQQAVMQLAQSTPQAVNPFGQAMMQLPQQQPQQFVQAQQQMHNPAPQQVIAQNIVDTGPEADPEVAALMAKIAEKKAAAAAAAAAAQSAAPVVDPVAQKKAELLAQLQAMDNQQQGVVDNGGQDQTGAAQTRERLVTG